MSLTYDISWSPGDKNLFLLIWKYDIYLFAIRRATEGSSENTFTVGLNKQFTLSVTGIWRNLIYPQCVVWLPSIDDRDVTEDFFDQLIAVGTSGGDVKLLGLQESTVIADRFGLHNKELLARYPRGSVCLAWNPWKRNLLAQVVDKTHPREPSILIWDVTKSTGSRSVTSGNASRDMNSANVLSLPLSMATTWCIPDPNVPQNNPSVAKVIPIYGVATSKHSAANTTDVMICDKTLCDFGTQETTSSFAWLTKSSFIAGVSGTYLKVFDLSDPTKPCQITSTRAVNGLTVDPLCSNRIASFYERQVVIWKVDSLEKPVYTFTEYSDVCQIKWSPLKQAWLGVLVADSCHIKVYDTFPMFLQSLDEAEQFPFERLVFPSGRPNCPLLAFSWHPSVSNCLLTLDREGCLDVAELVERPAVAWSPEQTLLWSHTGQWTTCDPWNVKSSRVVNLLNPSKPLTPVARADQEARLPNEEPALLDAPEPQSAPPVARGSNLLDLQQHLANDIASVMRRRAELGYGMGLDQELYISVVGENTPLGTMWRWIKYIQDYLDDSAIRYRAFDSLDSVTRANSFKETNSLPRSLTRCLGVVSVLSGESSPSGSPSVSEVLAYADWEGVDARLPFSRYRSPERSHVLRLCMWPLDDSDEVQRRVFESLCASGQYERAATMALINLKFNWALSFLNRASSAQRIRPRMNDEPEAVATNFPVIQDAGLVALALAGYTDAGNDLWRDTCANLINRLENPYLRVMFTFLSRQGGDFDPILNNDDLCLIDRVAFACLYLNDDDLLSYVRSLCDRMVRAGSLEAVLLTGVASADFISLIQQYVDATGDVQTAAIVGLHACQMASVAGHSSADSSASGAALHRSSEHQVLSRQTSVEGKGARTASNRPGPTDREVPLLIKLGGGARLANWVQCYRDLLDQWRMWFYRANFDITYKSRLVSECMWATSGAKSTPSNVASATATTVAANDPVRSTESMFTGGGAGQSGDTKPAVSPNSPMFGSCLPNTPTKVRNTGLVAAANQVFVACGFCGWRLGPQTRTVSITSASSGAGGATGPLLAGSDSTALASTGSARNLQMHEGGGKHTICQHCRKPLPRCAICLMHLGTVAPPLSESASTNPLLVEDALRQSTMAAIPSLSDNMARVLQLSIRGPMEQDPGLISSPTKRSMLSKQTPRVASSMSNWFVWCQACRHGGHANHLAEWFYGSWSNPTEAEYHSQCPVSGCQCKCASLDAMQPSPCSYTLPAGSAILGANLPRSVSVNSNVASQDEEDEDDADTRPLGLDDLVLRSSYLPAYVEAPRRDDGAAVVSTSSTFQPLSTTN